MNCPFCNNEMLDGATFCISCGKQAPNDGSQQGQPVESMQQSDVVETPAESLPPPDESMPALDKPSPTPDEPLLPPDEPPPAQAESLQHADEPQQPTIQLTQPAASKQKKPQPAIIALFILLGAVIILGVTVLFLLRNSLGDLFSQNPIVNFTWTFGGENPGGDAEQASIEDVSATELPDNTLGADASETSSTATTTAATTTTTASTTTTTTTAATTATTTTTTPSTTATTIAAIPSETTAAAISISAYDFMNLETVATIDNANILEYEFIYELTYGILYTDLYLYSPDMIAQLSMENIAKRRLLETLAKENGFYITQEMEDYLQQNNDYIEDYAASQTNEGEESYTGDDYMHELFGISKSQYMTMLESILLANTLLENEYNQMDISVDEAQDFYDNNAFMYTEATVRHILFMYETTDKDGNWRTIEESEKLANETVERIKAGEDMAELVWELSEDNYLDNEGLYSFTQMDSFEQGFLDWTFAVGRQVGDVGICETSYGYHVMRLEGMDPIPLENLMDEVVNQIKSTKIDELIQEWSELPRFEVQIIQDVYESIAKQVIGSYIPEYLDTDW